MKVAEGGIHIKQKVKGTEKSQRGVRDGHGKRVGIADRTRKMAVQAEKTDEDKGEERM